MPETESKPRSAVGSPAWKALEAHYKKVRKLHLRNLFADDPTRGERLTASAVGIELDYSKNRITDETLQLLFQLANSLADGRLGAKKLFGGAGEASLARDSKENLKLGELHIRPEAELLLTLDVLIY